MTCIKSFKETLLFFFVDKNFNKFQINSKFSGFLAK